MNLKSFIVLIFLISFIRVNSQANLLNARVPQDVGQLNEQQILRLYQSGIVTFSSHSHNHVKLTNISSKDLEFELSKSKEILI